MNRLEEFRVRQGLTRTQLANAVGLRSSALRRYELEGREPGFRIGTAIGKALGVDPERIWPPDPKGGPNDDT